MIIKKYVEYVQVDLDGEVQEWAFTVSSQGEAFAVTIQKSKREKGKQPTVDVVAVEVKTFSTEQAALDYMNSKEQELREDAFSKTWSLLEQSFQQSLPDQNQP